jgi:tape measure domain-containing protein
MSFQIKIVYDLIDKVSPQIKKINSIINNSASNLKNSTGNMANSFSQFSNLANQNVKQLNQNFSENINQISNSIDNFGSSLKNAGGKFAPLSFGIGAVGLMSLKSTANLETLGVQLEILTGSAEKGKKLFDELNKFAAQTPFETPEIVQATRTLLGSNIALEDVVKTTKMLGDVSAGSGGSIKSLAVVFGQVAGMTKLQGQDAMQFISNGIPIWALLQKTTGKSIDQLRKMGSDGKISFKMVEEALTKATQKNGMYYQATEKLSQTLGGVFSTLKDNINLTLAGLGEDIVATTNLKQVMKDFAITIENLSNKFKNLSPVIKQFIIYAGIITVALAPALLILGSITSAFGIMLRGVSLVTGGFALFTTAILTALNALRAIAVLAMANPFLTLIVASGLIYKYWGDISGIFSKIFSFIKQITFDDLIVAGNQIIKIFTTIFDIVVSILDKMSIFKDIKNIFDFAFSRDRGVKFNIPPMQTMTTQMNSAMNLDNPLLQSSPIQPEFISNSKQSFNGNIAVSFSNMPRNASVKSVVDNRNVNLGINSVFSPQ